MTDRLSNHLPQELRPLNGHTISPEQAAVGHETVAMKFDKPVQLTLVGSSIAFPAGVHQVPKHLVDHWYLKAHGVKPIENASAIAVKK